MNYKLLTFVLLGILLIELIIFVSPKNEPELVGGNWVTIHTDLPQFEGIRVYYQAFVKEQGTSSANLVQVCNMTTNECRKPYAEEIKQDRYLPQDFP